MLYDKYKNKMIAVRKARNFLYRFRILLISSASVVIATTITLLSIKGIPLAGVAVAKEVTYGDNLIYSDGALLNSEVSYEFSPASSEAWTFSEPTRPGVWKMRSVSSNGFGGKYYGNTNTFTILPKDIELKVYESTLTYGEKPTISTTLIAGDSITSYNVDFSSYSVTNPDVTPSLVGLTITNQKGEDVTSCYGLTPVTSSITITSRPLSVQVQDEKKEYDGEAPSNFSYLVTGGSLGYSDSLSLDYAAVSSSIGSHSIDGTATIKNKEGEDVTSFYSLHVSSGNMMISQRALSLTSSSSSKVYDGLALANNEVSITSGSLLLGDTLSYTFTNQNNKYVGSYSNSFTTKITNSDGKDVTANYALTPTYGTLAITKRPLSVTMPTTNFGEYDGLSHDDMTVNCDNLASTDHYMLRNTSSISKAGSVTNASLGSVLDSTGKDVTSNYDVTFNDGTLSLDPRKITIKASDASKSYDASPLYSSSYAVTSGSLASGDTISSTPLTTLTSAGTLTYSQSYVIKNSSGEDVTSSYSITPQEGLLTVTKRPISLTINYASKTYDGSPLKASSYALSSGSVVTGQILTVSTSSYLGSITHYRNNDQVSSLDNIKVLSSEGDVTKNYDISVVTGLLHINQRSITLAPDAVSGVIYDGLLHSPTSFHLSNGSLANGDSISGVNFTADSTRNDAGTYTTNIDSSSPIIIKNSANEVVYSYLDKDNSDYQISFASSSLEIEKRPIYTLTSSATKTYDGTALTSPSISLKSDSPYELVSGHSLSVSSSLYLSLTRAGTMYNTIASSDIYVLDATGHDVTKNYLITATNGKLTVNKRPLGLTSTGFSIDQYDGYSHSGGDFSISSGSLVTGETITYSDHKTFLQAGTFKNSFTVTINSPSLGDVTDCYDLNYTYGTVTIGKKPLSIKTYSSTWTYDSAAHSNTAFTYLDGTSLAVTDSISFSFSSITDVGSLSNKPISAYIFNNSASVTSTGSYEITYKEVGTLVVTKRTLTIASKDISKSYDATWNGDVTEVTYNGLASGDTITFYDDNPSHYSGQRPDVGNYTNYITYKITRTSGGDDVSKDYDVSISYGSFTITKANLTLKLPTVTELYNGTGSSVNGSRNDVRCSISSGTQYAADGSEFSINVVGDTIDSEGNSTYTTGTSTIIAKSFTITHPTYGDVSSNFNVTFINGSMTRTKRPLSISTGEVTTIVGFTYTSDPYLSSGSVAQGDSIIFTNGEKDATTVGTYTNSIDLATEVKIVNAKGVDMTYCYDLSIGSLGSLIILPLE